MAVLISSLIKKPANGGSPLIENIRKAKERASSRLSFFILEKLLISEWVRPLFISVNHLIKALRQ